MVEPASRGRNPFDETGVARDAAGRAHYQGRPDSLVQMLRASVEREADSRALVELGGGTLTYAELWERACRVAGGLNELGVKRGERVALRLANSIDWVVAFFGTQLLGAVVVPVNTRFTDDEVAYVVGDSGAVFTFVPGAALPDGDPLAVQDLAPDDLAAIFYTSGTTSQLIPVLELGGRVEILSSPLDIAGFFEAVGEDGVNQLVSVPAIYHAVVRHPQFAALDVSGVRWVSYGGAPISESLVERIKEAFPHARVGNGFGLTETSSLSSFLPHEEAAEHADSVGFAMPVVDLALHEPDPDTGVGELLVRGPNVVAGYWNKPEASAEAFVDGWLHTGDLARIDGDGLLYLVDRTKDMINRGGENVYSIEVENVLAGAPSVGEAAVVAVPDEMMGEKVGAVIVPAGGAQLDVDAVLEYCRARLADFKVPQYVAVREEPLPRNPGGKLLKARLREETRWGKPLR